MPLMTIAMKKLLWSALLVILASSTLAHVGAYTVDQGSQITSDNNNNIDPSLVYYRQNNTAWIFWSAQNQSLTPTFDVYYRIVPVECLQNASFSCLSIFHPTHRLTAGPGNNQFSSATQTVDGKIWIFFASDRNSNATRHYSTVFYKIFDGTSWSSGASRLTQWNGTDVHPSAIGTSDGGLLVAWGSDHNCVCLSNVWQQKYNGAGWLPPLQATSTGQDSEPSLSQAADGTIWLAYSEVMPSKNSDHDIFYKVINAGCSSNPLSCTPVDLSTINSTGAGDNEWPSIVAIKNGATNGAIVVVWASDRNNPSTVSYDLFMKYSLNNGSSWSTDIQLDNGSLPNDTEPSTAQVGPGRVGIVWMSDITGSSNIFSMAILVADVGVTAITPRQTVIRRGLTITVNVTLTNTGWEQEMPQLRLTANGTLINGNVIGSAACVAVATGTAACRVPYSGATRASFAWNTTGLRGHYVLTATEGNLTGDANTADNTLSTTVIVTIPGDVSGDGVVNIVDLAGVALVFGSTVGSPKYNPNMDSLLLGVIDIRDLVYVAARFGNTG